MLVLKGAEKGVNSRDLDLIITSCNCGCDEAIHIKKYLFEGIIEPMYNISVCGGKFYLKQKGVVRTVIGRLKNAWLALRGKEYLLCDVEVTASDIDKLIENLKEIRQVDEL